LSQLYDYAEWAGIVPATGRNPISLVKVEHATRRRKPRSLTVEEFQRILTHLKEPLRSMAIVAVSLGLRASEVLGLQWKHIDWLKSKLLVEQRIYRQHLDDTKTANSSGELNLDPSVFQILKDWRQATHAKKRIGCGPVQPKSVGCQSAIPGSGAALIPQRSKPG
jgi:integrase